MKEHPILMSAPMVRAILEGRKTQTRRIVKVAPPKGSDPGDIEQDQDFADEWFYWVDGGLKSTTFTCPYGKSGDRLWVRETWGVAGARLIDPCMNFRADGAQMPIEDRLDLGFGIKGNQYGASTEQLLAVKDGWRSSMFMPRWASRITLEITEVRGRRVPQRRVPRRRVPRRREPQRRVPQRREDGG